MSVFRCPFLTLTTSISAVAYLLYLRSRSLLRLKSTSSLKDATPQLIGAIETGGTFTTLSVVKVFPSVLA